jgi:hypoxanthine phosphoribosyltransferase
MMDRVKVFDKEFELSIPSARIQKRIRELADEISNDMKEMDPLFIGILNGSFIFASDLFKRLKIDARITFLKLQSYQGTRSSGEIKQLIGLSQDIKDMNIVILEDIVDTGQTLETSIKELSGYKPASIRVVTLLFKPEACIKKIHLDYTGFSIPDKFVIGYGLDYKGFGRKYEDIYTLVSEG